MILRGVRDVLASPSAPPPPSTTVVDTRVNWDETSTDLRSVPNSSTFTSSPRSRSQSAISRERVSTGPDCSTRMSLYTSGITARIGMAQTGHKIWYPFVSRRYGRARSIAAPAIGAPSSRPRPFVVVPSPETAPRCSSGISLKSKPQASVITRPPDTATGMMSAKYQVCQVDANPATRNPHAVHPRRPEDHAREPEAIAQLAGEQGGDDVAGRNRAEQRRRDRLRLIQAVEDVQHDERPCRRESPSQAAFANRKRTAASCWKIDQLRLKVRSDPSKTRPCPPSSR